jgi:CHAT domain-containing protein/tetratricopeptide (TPR) repeat protein
MSRKILTVLILFVSPLFSFGQSSSRDIQTETDLVVVLCTQEGEPAREQLLVSHPRLVNKDLWQALNSRAATAYYISSPEQSLATYNIAIEVAVRLKNPRLLATTYYNIGRTYSGLNQISKAIDAYERSRSVFEESNLQNDLTYILADLGLLYFIQEDYAHAARYSEQALSLSETAKANDSPGVWPIEYGRATALSTLANLDLREGNFGEAIQKLKKALTLHQQLNRDGSSFNSYIAGDLQTIGRVYTASGDYPEALRYLDDALKIVRSVSDADSMANLQNSIGTLYLEQEDYAQAKKSFDESLRVYLSNDNQREAASVLLNLGVIEQRQSNFDEALARFKSSLDVAKRVHCVDAMIAAGEGIGVVLTAKHEFSAALGAFGQSLKLAKDIQETTRQTELAWRMSQTYYEMEKYQEAVSCAEEAVALGRASHSPKLTYLATTTLGESYAAQNKIELATQTLERAVGELELMRNQVAGSEVESQLFFENKVNAYHSLVDLLIKQGKPLEALLYGERAKGRVLLDVLTGGRADLTKTLTPTERAERERLSRKISEINESIGKKQVSGSSQLNSLYAQLDAARLEYQSFQDALYVTHPNLRIRSGHTASLSAADLNELTANGDTAYLEYVAAKDYVSLFVLSKNKSNGALEVKAYTIAIKPEDLNRRVEEFHDALAEQRLAYTTAARDLYTLLIAPAEQQLRGVGTISIVPDSFLWNVPFQALMSPSEHFLIEDHALYYAPSLSVLREMNKKKGKGEMTNTSLLAFGNPVIGKDEQRNADLCPLPEAEQEVSSIAKSFDEKNSRVFIGRDASEKSFKTLAPIYSIIHLATHGVIDNRQPLYSHLLLTKTEGDPENDGRLEARQIMDMNLNADLAVLSACETANGRVASGEGVIGMSWAFFVAGTRSMVVSQWKIGSASTSDFMTAFYQNLHSANERMNGNKAEAIREAQLTLLKDNRYRHPFFWAGFVMVGSGS